MVLGYVYNFFSIPSFKRWGLILLWSIGWTKCLTDNEAHKAEITMWLQDLGHKRCCRLALSLSLQTTRSGEASFYLRTFWEGTEVFQHQPTASDFRSGSPSPSPAFRWLQPRSMPWLQSHEGLWARLPSSWLSDPQKLWDSKCCFKPLSFRVICHAAAASW